MSFRIGALALIFILSACEAGGGMPQGQVVATVDGQEVTAADLNAEMGGPERIGEQTSADQAAALDRIVVRKLLAAESRKRGLDDSATAAVLVRHAEEQALAQALLRKLAQGLPKVSDSEVSEFIRNYPASIADRRLLSIDQLFVPAASSAVFAKIQKLKKLEDVEALLVQSGLKYRRTSSVIDTMTVDPNEAAQILSTEGKDIFVRQSGSSLEIGRIVANKAQPISPTEAKTAATNVLQRQRVTSQLSNSVDQIVKSGRTKVKINPAYLQPGQTPQGGAAK